MRALLFLFLFLANTLSATSYEIKVFEYPYLKINNTGWMLFASQEAGYFLQSPEGEIIDLQLGQPEDVLDMNDEGQLLIVNDDDAFTIFDGKTKQNLTETMIQILDKDGKELEAQKLNNQGQVMFSSGIWSTKEGWVNLREINEKQCSFADLNDKGEMIGAASEIEGNPFTDPNAIKMENILWSSEKGLQMLPCFNGAKTSLFGLLNNVGDKVGVSSSSAMMDIIFGNYTHLTPFFYNEEKGFISFGSLKELHVGYPMSMNDVGQVVGFYGLDMFVRNSHYPFVWDEEHGVRDLNDLIPQDGRWIVLYRADQINNKGQIVVEGELDGQPTCFLLTPQEAKKKSGSSSPTR